MQFTAAALLGRAMLMKHLSLLVLEPDPAYL